MKSAYTPNQILVRLFSIAAILTATILVPLSASFSAEPVSSASTSLPADFTSGVTAFKGRRFEEAKQIFLALESQHPDDPTLLLNLGLIAQKEKQLGAAMGLWRKGLASHPSNDSLLNAVDWIRPKLPKAEIARRIDLWEQWRGSLFGRVSPLATITLSALFLFAAGAYLLRWWGARRRAYAEESALPAAPLTGIVMSLLFVFLFLVSGAIFIDRLDLRGTIIVEKTEVRSAPEASATPLFEAFEGMEVIVREARSVDDANWRRVTYPGGGTGWIRGHEVFTAKDPSIQAFKAPGVQP